MAISMGNLVAIMFLVVGVVLLVLGFQEYGAFGSKIAKALGSRPSNEVLAYFAGGGVFALAGVIKLIKK